MISKITIKNFQDIQDREGNWLKSFSKTIDGVCVHWRTRSGCIWNAIQKRTKIGGAVHNETGRYEGVTNKFKGFQEFAEWCQSQEGYWLKELNGNFWSLDKDLLDENNSRCYSPETCVFVPVKVNCLMGPHVKGRAEYGIGVTKTPSGRFTASIGQYPRKLGTYDSAMEAHRAWQSAKVKDLLDVSRTDQLGGKVQSALMRLASKIQLEISQGVETILD